MLNPVCSNSFEYNTNVGRKYLGNGYLKEAKPVAYMESGNTPGDRSLGVRPALFEAEKSEAPPSHPSRIVSSLGTLIDGGDEPRLGGEPKEIVQPVEDYRKLLKKGTVRIFPTS